MLNKDLKSGTANLGCYDNGTSYLGKAVQVEPMKPMLKASGTERLTVKYDKTGFKL